MDSIFSVENISKVLVASSGLLAGTTFTISMVAVPALHESNDPLPVWQTVYKRGSKMALSSIAVTTVSGITCFVRSGMGVENGGYLAAGLLALSIAPYTIIFMKPINDHLFSLKRTEEAKTVKSIVGNWEKHHWVRSTLGLVVFGICAFKIAQSK